MLFRSSKNSAAYTLLRLGKGGDAETTDNAEQNDDKKKQSDEDEVDKLEVVFDKNLGRDTTTRKGLVRYQHNPTENWGPLSRASG